MLTRRENSVIITGLAFASAYRIVATPVGGRVASASPGSTITFDAPHSFRAGDKALIRPGSDNLFTAAISSVTATTIVFSAETYSVSVGDQCVNLGPDTGTTTPAYNSSPMKIYADPDGGTVYSTSTITCDAQGAYGYYHRGDGRFWELILDSSNTPAGVIAGHGAVAGRLSTADFGAAIDGSTDDTERIQAAIDATQGVGAVYFPDGTSRIASGITIDCHVESTASAKLEYNATTGTAITLRSGAGGTRMRWKNVDLPHVQIVTQQWSGATSGTDVGVRTVNLNDCRVWFQHVEDFSIGVKHDAEGDVGQNNGGNAYNNFFYTHLDNNKINLQITRTGSDGWCNESNHFGGQFSHNSAEGSDISGCRQIECPNTTIAVNQVNGHKFYGCSLEGNGPEFHLDWYGDQSIWFGCRWEATTPKVRWGAVAGEAVAAKNWIWSGQNAENIVYTRQSNNAENVTLNAADWFLDGASGMRIIGGNVYISDDDAYTVGVVEDLSNNPGGASDVLEAVVSTTADETVSHNIAVADGTRNSRAKFFLTDDAAAANRTFGLWQSFTSGAANLVFGIGGTEVFRMGSGGLFELVTGAGVTAGTTQTQAGATALTAPVSEVSTCANSGDGVLLPLAVAGRAVKITNNGAEACQVWPNTNDTVDGQTADAVDPNLLYPGDTREYVAYDGVAWRTVGVVRTANLAHWQHGHLSESITLNTGGTTTDSSANLLPAGCIIDAVVARVTTTITTASNWSLGDATVAKRFLTDDTGLTAGSTGVGLEQNGDTGTGGAYQTAAAALRITTTGTPGAGVIRVTVFYRQFVAPTS